MILLNLFNNEYSTRLSIKLYFCSEIIQESKYGFHEFYHNYRIKA